MKKAKKKRERLKSKQQDACLLERKDNCLNDMRRKEKEGMRMRVLYPLFRTDAFTPLLSLSSPLCCLSLCAHSLLAALPPPLSCSACTLPLNARSTGRVFMKHV